MIVCITPVLCAITKSSGHCTRILTNARRNAAFGDECVFEEMLSVGRIADLVRATGPILGTLFWDD